MKILKTILKSLLAVISLVLLVYISFQVYSLIYPIYRSETALLYTMTDSVPCRGIAVRNETTIDFSSAGTLNFKVKDGDKIATNAIVADVYPSKAIARDVKARSLLQNEKDTILKAREAGKNAGVNLDSLTAQIYRLMVNISESVNSNSFDGFEYNRLSTIELLSVFSSATGTDLGYEEAVIKLENEIQKIDQILVSSSGEIRASEGGYFVSYTDGFEAICYRDGNIYKSSYYAQEETAIPYGISDIIALTNSSAYWPNNNSCKVISDYNWYFAAITDIEYLQRFFIGQTLLLDLDHSEVSSIPVIVVNIYSDENLGKTMIIFSCEYLNSDMTGLRVEQGEISFRDYKGIRIPRSAIHVMDSEIGVYVKYDNKVVFKKIDYLFETKDFIIARPSEHKDELKLYDEIILEGKDLYDGKSLG